MTLASDLQALAKDLLQEFGEQATFTRTTSGEYSPETGQVATTTSTFTADVQATEYSNNEIDGELIKHGDLRVIVYTSGNVPQANDTITFNSKTYRALSVEPKRLQGSNVIYEVQARL